MFQIYFHVTQQKVVICPTLLSHECAWVLSLSFPQPSPGSTHWVLTAEPRGSWLVDSIGFYETQANVGTRGKKKNQ